MAVIEIPILSTTEKALIMSKRLKIDGKRLWNTNKIPDLSTSDMMSFMASNPLVAEKNIPPGGTIAKCCQLSNGAY